METNLRAFQEEWLIYYANRDNWKYSEMYEHPDNRKIWIMRGTPLGDMQLEFDLNWVVIYTVNVKRNGTHKRAPNALVSFNLPT